ncbi:hypothetical protein LO762_13110 [Actinocorallia sp. API 0066]|uniref:hypothetical protein n=1 Tax=Actinocorallia sp. API 0066 TaxID=2896846 RepID=UPI001E28A2FC|nr:hypothetical protein [Actinocorallia sp. API 0066]MCD0450124.1 hypothetical protein [Actinocorallia sp. API 0066]
MSDALLFTVSLAVTVLGLLASWRVGRGRGAASGLRGAAWSLVPLGFYLTGLTGFLASLVFSPAKWAGVVVLALAGVLYVVSGVRLRSSAGRPGRAGRTGGAHGGEPRRAGAGAQPPAVGGAARRPAPPIDDEMAEIEEILRRRGI